MLKIAPVALCAFLSFALAGCALTGSGGSSETQAASMSADHGDHAQCACKGGTEGKTFWCDKCGAGYVDGQKVKCKGCYEAKTQGTPCIACGAKKSAGG